MSEPEVIRTRVGIVGGGPGRADALAPAGHRPGSTTSWSRSATTRRSAPPTGPASSSTAASHMLVDSGVSDRVLTAGYKHEGIDLRFGGESHRIDFTDLVGEAVWLYPQNEVFVDLAAARERDGGRGLLLGVRHRGARPDHRHPEDPVHRRGRHGQGDPRRDPGRRRRVRAASASGRSRRSTAPTTSSSTPSPGSASCARRRRAPRS